MAAALVCRRLQVERNELDETQRRLRSEMAAMQRRHAERRDAAPLDVGELEEAAIARKSVSEKRS